MKRLLAILIAVSAAASVFTQDIPLQKPARSVGIDLAKAIQDRRVSRTFVKKEIPAPDLSFILWAGLGLRPVDAVSSATKAGRNISFSGEQSYINIYLLTEKGAYKYQPEIQALKFIKTGDLRALISQAAIPNAAAMVVYTVDNSLTPSFLKANPATFTLMSHATAGFAAQNISLAASARNLASIIQYSLKAQGAIDTLGLAKDEVPLFIQQIGFTE